MLAASAPPSANFGSMHIFLEKRKGELRKELTALGFPQSVLPGGGEAKGKVDLLIAELEAMTPVTFPLRAQSAQLSSPEGPADPLLLGQWVLVYASNGTVVTRSTPAQIILAASQLPGVGLQDIQQQLNIDSTGEVSTTNQAVFGLGPFGQWRVGVNGIWRSKGDGKTAKVFFNSISIRMVDLMGLRIPDWLPALSLPSGISETAGREGAEWLTTYLDDDMRVGRGKSGVFVFYRRKGRA